MPGCFEMESIIEGRSLYLYKEGSNKLPVINDGNAHFISCAMPIITEGDIVGCVASVADINSGTGREINAELETKLIQTAASFLGKQLES